MPQYEVDVIEVRHYSVKYTVEADNKLEAKHKAEKGETVGDEEMSCDGVMDRTITSEPVKVPSTDTHIKTRR